MTGCCAVHCHNRSENGFRMYKFPTKDLERRKLWVSRVRRLGWRPTASSAICQEHFDQSQFGQTRSGKKKLRRDAVPSIFNHKPYKDRTRRSLGLSAENSEMKEGGSVSVKTVYKDHSYCAAPQEKKGSSSGDPILDTENRKVCDEAQQTILLQDINVRRSWAEQKELFLKCCSASKENARTDDEFVSHLLTLHAKKCVALPSGDGSIPTRPRANTNTRLDPSGVHFWVQGADKADVLRTSRLLSMNIARQTLNPSVQSNVPVVAGNVLPDSNPLTILDDATMAVLPETSAGVTNLDTSTDPKVAPGDCTLQSNTMEDSEVSKSRITQDGGTTSKCDVCQKMYQRDKLNYFFDSQQERCLVKCDMCIFSERHSAPDNQSVLVPQYVLENPPQENVVRQDDLGMTSLCVDLASEQSAASYRPRKYRPIMCRDDWPQRVGAYKGEERFKCKVCFKVFTDRTRLFMHMKTHRKCVICLKTFNRLGQFIAHIRSHTGVKPFVCKLCPKAYSSVNGLSTHVRTHTGEKPYECDTCGKAFTRRTSYTSHKKMHTGIKPFECNVCHKAFFQKSGLKAHLTTHTKEKSFKCNLCAEAFTCKTPLQTHMKTHRKVKSVQRENDTPEQFGVQKPLS